MRIDDKKMQQEESYQKPRLTREGQLRDVTAGTTGENNDD